LLRQIAAGDQAAFDELYRHYSGPIYNYLLRLVRDTPAAEELLQEVFIAAWTNAAAFRGQAQVKTWLLRIAHNQAVSWLRRLPGTLSLDEAAETLSDDTLDEQVIQAWRADQVGLALERLAPKHREVIELTFTYGLSYAEIAQIVGCPPGTVKSRMNYALRFLNGVLGGTGLAEAPAR
jgi:RNA polymerase sigma-70 factor (ECF subfamily)